MSMWSDLVHRMRALVFRAREERETDEELRFHLSMQAEALRRTGAGDAVAGRRATQTLGGVEQVKEEIRDARGTRFIEDVGADLALSLRLLRHSPRFAVAAILTIAIGIGGTTAMFSAVDAVLLKPLPYQQPGQLVRLYQYYAGRPDALTFVTAPHYRAYRTELAAFDALAATFTYGAVGADIESNDRAERIRILPVTADYFRVVAVAPALGRGFESTEEIDAPVVILSHELWQRLFHGRANALGRSLTMSGVPRTIVGVMPRGFEDPLIPGLDAWVPQDLRSVDAPYSEMNHVLTVIGRLRPGITHERAQTELDGLSHALTQQFPRAADVRAMLVPLKEDLAGPASQTLELMLGAVALVLVLACVNVANLLLVRASERGRELALRAALGARRQRLIRQLLTESIVLAAIGGVAGLALGRALMPLIGALGAASIPRVGQLTLNWPVLAVTGVVSVASAIGFGLAPALRGSRAAAMREEGRGATGGRALGRLRSGLVVSQVALALLLLVGAGLLLATVDQLRRTDLGLAPDRVLTFELTLPAARYDSTARGRFYEEFATAVAALPGVRAIGGISRLPVTGRYHTWGRPVPLTGPLAGATTSEGQIDETDNRVISGDYFRAVGMHVLKGRTFDARDVPGASHRVVISASLARQAFPGVDPIGQRLHDTDVDCEVVGVVNDVAYDAEGHTAPIIYHAHRQYAGDRNWELTQVVAANVPPPDVEDVVRRTLATLDPLLVMYQPKTLDEVIGQGRGQRLFTLRVVGAFATVALVLAALGLFGVLSYAVRLRGKEIGIRMALGADSHTIRGMVLRDGARVTATGVLIGLVGAVALSRVTASFIFGVSPLDPLVLAGATLFLSLVAAVAAYLPARRASSLAPQRVLQGD